MDKGLMVIGFYCILLIIIPTIMDNLMEQDGFKWGVRSALVLSLVLFELFGKNYVLEK